MTYQFPESLDALRRYLKSQGFEGDSIKTSRQAAFVAQQLLGSRIKFPAPGSDMTSTLFLIQKELPARVQTAVSGKSQGQNAGKPAGSRPESADPFGKQDASVKAKGKKGKKSPHKPEKPTYLRAFSPEVIATGYHIFADGASVPNPGIGGWGVVAYRDGQEIHHDYGGDDPSTNNAMELTAVLRAIEWASQYPTIKMTIWTDSQYVCNGINDWMKGWKRNGWQRGGAKAEPKNRILLNADLWQAIDAALSGPRAANISVFWVKGHAGHVWNERADELAEIGRQGVAEACGQVDHTDDLDAEYRAVMAG